MSDRRAGNWMSTYTGRRFYPLDPREDEVYLNDISHALSNICRYGGHTLGFYSVAQHSVLVSYIVREEYALMGLLHDAAEAYLGDIIRPLKGSLFVGVRDFECIESHLLQVIFRALKVDYPHWGDWEHIKTADAIAMKAEVRNLMIRCDPEWAEKMEKIPNYSGSITAVDSVTAQIMFENRFKELTGRNG